MTFSSLQAARLEGFTHSHDDVSSDGSPLHAVVSDVAVRSHHGQMQRQRALAFVIHHQDGRCGCPPTDPIEESVGPYGNIVDPVDAVLEMVNAETVRCWLIAPQAVDGIITSCIREANNADEAWELMLERFGAVR